MSHLFFTLLFPVVVLAASSSSAPATGYTDVPITAWYAESVQALREDGYLNTAHTQYHPQRNAARAEFLKIVMGIAGVEPSSPPLLPSFDDVPKNAWYFQLIEDAAKEEWVKGDGNCYGSHPCKAYPEKRITRGEAAALLVRILVIERTNKGTPRFIDVGDSDWFSYAIYAAAERCIMAGDLETLRVRPNDPLNRAEMAVVLQRAQLVKAGKKICM